MTYICTKKYWMFYKNSYRIIYAIRVGVLIFFNFLLAIKKKKKILKWPGKKKNPPILNAICA